MTRTRTSRAGMILDGVQAICTIVGVEIAKHKERTMKHDEDEDEIDRELSPLPSDVEVRCGLNRGEATVGLYHTGPKGKCIVQFRQNKTSTARLIADLTKIHSIMEDDPTPAA